MMQREIQKVKLLNYSDTLDEYGQKKTGTATETEVEMVVHDVNLDNVSSPKYVDVVLVGITKEIVTDKNKVKIGDKVYIVKYVQHGPKYYQVFMSNE